MLLPEDQNPPVASAIEAQQPRTIKTDISWIDLKLGELIKDVAKANGYESSKTIEVLELHGLPSALQFVQPLLEILKRGTDSPLRQLSTFEVACLYVDNDRRQQIVLEILEEEMRAGRSVRFETGMTKQLWATYRARVQAAKHREGVQMNRTRDDYQREVMELRGKLQTYEIVLEQVASQVDQEVNEFVSNILKEAV